MRDVELYRSLLGLTAPWAVAAVEVDMKGQRIVVGVAAVEEREESDQVEQRADHETRLSPDPS